MSRKRSNNLLADDGDTRVVKSITAKTADLGKGNPGSDRQHHTPRRTTLLYSLPVIDVQGELLDTRFSLGQFLCERVQVLQPKIC